jgi:predicted DNA-binding ribbon-helix-helix protein
MQPAVKKRSVVVGGHKTSISLENEFWECLRDIAQSQQMSLSALLATIKAEQRENSLSSAIRVFVLNHYRDVSTCVLAITYATIMSEKVNRSIIALVGA